MFDLPEDMLDQGLAHRHKTHDIKHLDVYIYSFDQSLNLDTDESYTLAVSSTLALQSLTA